jgi:predicted RNA binding protein YcfA (HicA-like mRNA interferase family)
VAKLPILSPREVIKVLAGFGFHVVRQTGSHIHLWHEERRLLVTVPNHPEVARGTLASILKQARLSREEFLGEL